MFGAIIVESIIQGIIKGTPKSPAHTENACNIQQDCKKISFFIFNFFILSTPIPRGENILNIKQLKSQGFFSSHSTVKIIALAKKRFLLHYLAQINLIGENNGIKI